MITVEGAVELPTRYKRLFDRFYATFPLAEDWGKLISYRDVDYSWALYNAQPAETDVVLDVGCACCYFVNCLAKFASKVYGIDLIYGWPTWAVTWLETMERYDDFRSGKIDITVGNASELPYPDASIDKVYTFSALEHFEGRDDILCSQEIARVLKPGGVFIGTVDYNRATEYPSAEHKNERVYTHASFMERIIIPSGLSLQGEDFEREKDPQNYVGTKTSALCFILRKEAA
jgi:ubiquinone/menaquinone biosynthesis C-methylase UbiE